MALKCLIHYEVHTLQSNPSSEFRIFLLNAILIRSVLCDANGLLRNSFHINAFSNPLSSA